VAAIDKARIERLDTRFVTEIIDILTQSIIRSRRPYGVELAISGYDNDTRQLDQIPEVTRWARHVQHLCPSFLAFHAPGSMLRWLMWVAPSFCRWHPGRRVELLHNDSGFELAFAASCVAYFDDLQSVGISDDELSQYLAPQLQRNVIDMFDGKHRFGVDYSVAESTVLLSPLA
jgi:hypothetical protein